ncbi:hypothetical protein R2F25_23280 [Streptomyces sp. UP1A-1]|nr:hypothetical protein [Streptomyces sp. UP1A-1]
MMRELPAPPRADEFGELISKRVEEVREAGGTRETVSVELNGQPLHVEVIDLPLSRLYYNPSTHRIRAQRSHDPERDAALDKDPWSGESQDYLHFLLQASPSEPGSEGQGLRHPQGQPQGVRPERSRTGDPARRARQRQHQGRRAARAR